MSILNDNLNQILQEKEQKIIPENIKSGVQIFDVVGTYEGSGIDTSDATATANDILNPKTAYVNGEKITGNILSLDGVILLILEQDNPVEVDETGIIFKGKASDDGYIMADVTSIWTQKINNNIIASAIGLTADKIKAGDVLVGIPSSGVHSNGYSLVRKICFEVKGFDGSEKFDELGGKTLGEELLTPTRLYPSVCLPLIEKYDIHGMVHVTGGGFYENISRILPEGTGVSVNADAWEMPAIFKLLQQWGNVDWHEMYRVFNMGIGMILLVSSEDAKSIQADLAAKGEKSYIIGEVVEGNQTVEVKGGVFNE